MKFKEQYYKLHSLNQTSFNEEWPKFCKIIDKKFKNKCVIDLNDKNKFDIFEIIHRKPTSLKYENASWQLFIIQKKKISIKNCSSTLFDNLKVLGKAEHKFITVN